MLLKKLLIVINQTNDGVFSTDIIGLVCTHGMVEVQVDPLTNIKLVLVVSVSNNLD